jgi:hypothetical protein
VEYSEKLLVGYRYYDTKNVDPLFPFGFGLSYTSFEYSNLKIDADTTGISTHVNVSFDIKNAGAVDGAEVAQLYIRQPDALVERPYKELKGFSKIFLHADEKQTVTVSLDSSSFAYYKASTKGFGMDYGTFKVLIGASSKDIRLTDSIKFNNPSGVKPLTVAYYPENNSQLASTTQKFSIRFNCGVYFMTGKKIVIREETTGDTVETVTSTNGTETDSITFINHNLFKLGSTYYIEVDSNAFTDYYGHMYEGLYGTDKWRFTVTLTGIKQLNENIGFKIFPVPASDYIIFLIPDGPINRKLIEIYDGLGKLIDVKRIDKTIGPVDYNCSALKNGIYYCKYISNETSHTKVILIEK